MIKAQILLGYHFYMFAIQNLLPKKYRRLDCNMQHIHVCFTGHTGVCFSDAECGYGEHCDHPMCDTSSHQCHCGRKKHFILLLSDKCVRMKNLTRREQQSVLS